MRKEQTKPQDDFEEACKKSGIEIIEAEAEEEPQGVGGADYSPRTTAPSYTNPFYLKRGMGGYNPCILIEGNSCLANCVGYAHGRTLEIMNKESDDRYPTCNAKDWLAVAKANGLSTGQSPRQGDVIVWDSAGYGHVGVVEEVYDGGKILVSQSNYGGTRFFLTNHYPPYDIYGQTFIGFIHNPKFEGRWRKNDVGWWWDYGDGTYPVSKWELINGKWYHFDDKGYMQTGWLKLKNGDFYLNPSGDMATGWKKINGVWYFFNNDGYMQTGWLKDGGKWYWLGNNGKMVTGWINQGGKRYYLGADGAMLTGKHNVPCQFNDKGELI